MILALKPLTKTISNNVKRYRKSRKMTQEAVAARAELSFRTYQNVEYGVGYPEEENLVAVAKALGVTPAHLMDEREVPMPKPSPEEALEVLREALARTKAIESIIKPTATTLADTLAAALDDGEFQEAADSLYGITGGRIDLRAAPKVAKSTDKGKKSG